MAQESNAEYLTPESLPEGFEAIPLPGHFFDMVGYRTPDNVVFLADCLSSVETLEKYRIGFIYDVAAYLKTLETVKTMQAKLFIPSHAAVTENIADLAEYNIRLVKEIAEHIAALCETPHGFEEILWQLFSDYSLTMNFEQYVLVGSTVRSYLAWLKDTGRLAVLFEDNMLRWVSAAQNP
jgi:glyoxylase-like metal-dependent hydrolase (beta-lactamase superfamily II)